MSTPSSPASPRGELGFWMCTALVIGNTIGMGIFLLPAGLAPLGLNAVIGWIVTVFGCLAVAQVFARFARRFPDPDGPYGYLKTHLGEVAAFSITWCYWISLWVTNATLATGVVGYLTAVVPGLGSVPHWILALGLIWIFVGVNLLGAKAGGEVQVLTTALKLLPMLVVVALSVWVLFTDPVAYTRSVPPNPIQLSTIMIACTTVLFAMLGIESAAVPTGRVKDPERTIPRATIVGTLIVAVIYIVVSTVPMLLIPQDQLAQSGAPFVLLLDRLLGAGPGRWLALFVVISGIGALNGWTLLTGELSRTMAQNGVLPSALARSNGRGAPSTALVITGVLASIMTVMNYAPQLVKTFVLLTTIVSLAALPLYLGCSLALALVWWRRVRPASRDLVVYGGLGVAYSLFAFFGGGWLATGWALGLAAAGIPVYFLMKGLKSRSA